MNGASPDQVGLRYGVSVPNFADADTLVVIGASAEAYGWDGCFYWDHILGSLDTPVPMSDPWVALGALAISTERILIGTAVTPLPRRRPHKLAREAVTVDRLSRGRMVLGVGLGTPIDAEYAAFGEPSDPAALAEMLDEGLEVLAGLWSGRQLDHAGAHYRVQAATFLPTPQQQPRIPVWVAATWPHMRPVARAALWDGVVAANITDAGRLEALSADAVATIADEMRLHRTAASAYDIVVVHPGAPTTEEAADFAAAGATWCLVAGWIDALRDIIEAGPPGGMRSQ